MLEGLRQRIGLSYSRLHFRNTRDHKMNFTEALSRSRRALVIFPESPPDGDSVLTLFRYFIKKFSTDGIMVLIRDDQLYSMVSTPPLNTLTYSADDINSWFIPKRELQQRIMANTYDVALDLNIGFSLPGAFLCKVSNAPLRVSFVKNRGDQFYNLQFQTKDNAAIARIYRNFLKFLDMF